jgi:RimJ/RimL family protein N-acetyltransferase
MLRGERVLLRHVREADLDQLFTFLADIRTRGEFFPINVTSEVVLRRNFADNGFWSQDEGLLLITNADGNIIGHIEFFKPVNYLDMYELSYLIYDLGSRNQGAATEAVQLLTRYLFDTRKLNRIQLIIHPENAASRRIADKCGFQYEGVMRGAWYNRGRSHDVAVYALLRDEYRQAQSAQAG